MTIKARATAGRLGVNEPTHLPDRVDLLRLDPGDGSMMTIGPPHTKHCVTRMPDVSAGRLVDVADRQVQSQ
jgi:hypothetical protein